MFKQDNFHKKKPKKQIYRNNEKALKLDNFVAKRKSKILKISSNLILNKKYNENQRQIKQQNFINEIDALIYRKKASEEQDYFSSKLIISYNESLILSKSKEYLNNYFPFSYNHQSYMYGNDHNNIESNFVEGIKLRRIQMLFRVVIHFEGVFYNLLMKHQSKMDKYKYNWIKNYQTKTNCSEPKNEQILPKKSLNNKKNKNPLNNSESIQINQLADYISKMFNPKIVRNNLGCKLNHLTSNQPLFLQIESNINNIEVKKKSSIDLEISAIEQLHSKIDSESFQGGDAQVEENYGLDELKRKYMQIKLFKQKNSNSSFQNNEIKSKLGHYRNPTDGFTSNRSNCKDGKKLNNRIKKSVSAKHIKQPGVNSPLKDVKKRKAKGCKKSVYFDQEEGYFEPSKPNNIKRKNEFKENQLRSKSNSKNKMKSSSKKKKLYHKR